MAFLRRATRIGKKAVRFDLYVRVFSLEIPPASVPKGLDNVVVELERGKRSDKTSEHKYDSSMWTGDSPLSVPVTLYKDPKRGTFQSKPFTLKLRTPKGDLLATYTLDAAQFANITEGASSTATRTLKLSAVKGKSKLLDAKLSITVGCDFRSEPTGDGDTSTVLTGTTVVMDEQDLSGFDDLGDDFGDGNGDLGMMDEGDEDAAAAAEDENSEAFGHLINDVDSLLASPGNLGVAQEEEEEEGEGEGGGGGGGVERKKEGDGGEDPEKDEAEGQRYGLAKTNPAAALRTTGSGEGMASPDGSFNISVQRSDALESAEDAIALLQALANDDPEKKAAVDDGPASVTGEPSAEDGVTEHGGEGTGVSVDEYAMLAMSENMVDETNNLMEGLRSDISLAINKRREDSEQQTKLLDELDVTKELISELRDALSSSEKDRIRAEDAAVELKGRADNAEAKEAHAVEAFEQQVAKSQEEQDTASAASCARIGELEQQNRRITDKLEGAEIELKAATSASTKSLETIGALESAASEREAAAAVDLEKAEARAAAAETALAESEAAAAEAALKFDADLEDAAAKAKAEIDLAGASTASEAEKLAAKQHELDGLAESLKASENKLSEIQSELSLANASISELNIAASKAKTESSSAAQAAEVDTATASARIHYLETEVENLGGELSEVQKEAEATLNELKEESLIATEAAVKALDTISEMESIASEREAAAAADLEKAETRVAAAEAALASSEAAAAATQQAFEANLEKAAAKVRAEAEEGANIQSAKWADAESKLAAAASEQEKLLLAAKEAANRINELESQVNFREGELCKVKAAPAGVADVSNSTEFVTKLQKLLAAKEEEHNQAMRCNGSLEQQIALLTDELHKSRENLKSMESFASHRNAASSAAVETAEARAAAAEATLGEMKAAAADAEQKFRANLEAAVQSAQDEAIKEISKAKAEAESKVAEMHATASRKLAEVCVGTASVVTAEAKELNEVWRLRAIDAEKQCAVLEDQVGQLNAKASLESVGIAAPGNADSSTAAAAAANAFTSATTVGSDDDSALKASVRKATRSLKSVRRRLCEALESLGESGKKSVELTKAATLEEERRSAASFDVVEHTAAAVDELIELLVADVQSRSAKGRAQASGDAPGAPDDKPNETGPTLDDVMKAQLETAMRTSELVAAVDAGKREVASIQRLLTSAKEATDAAECAAEEATVEVDALKTMLLKANLDNSDALAALRTSNNKEVASLRNELSKTSLRLQAAELRLASDASNELPPQLGGGSSSDKSLTKLGMKGLKAKLAATSKVRDANAKNLEGMQLHSEQLRADISGKICKGYIDLNEASEHVCGTVAATSASDDSDAEVIAATAAAMAATAATAGATAGAASSAATAAKAAAAASTVVANETTAPQAGSRSSWGLNAMKAKRDAFFR